MILKILNITNKMHPVISGKQIITKELLGKGIRQDRHSTMLGAYIR